MKLVDDWRRVLRRAWSLRLMAVAGLLTGCEAVIQTVGADFLPVPAWARQLVVLGVTAGAFITRLLAQPERKDG